MKIYNIPTGKIAIMNGDKGKLEFLSIGDYGATNNVKADFLGLTKEIDGVPNGEIMPLEEKWVVTISSQYSCVSNCKFCDVPKVNNGTVTTKTTFWGIQIPSGTLAGTYTGQNTITAVLGEIANW